MRPARSRRPLLAGALGALLLPLVAAMAAPALALLVPAGAELRVNLTTAGGQARPSVAMAADGSFVVAWDSGVGDGDAEGVFARRFAPDGTTRGGEFRGNTTPTGAQVRPSIGMAPDGRFVVTWTSAPQDGNGDGVYAQRYAADGTTAGVEALVNTYTTGSQSESVAAMASDGRFVVAWQSLAQDGNDYGVYARRYALDGLQSDELRVNTVTASSLAYHR